MHPEDIKMNLRLMGTTQSHIAAQVGVSRMLVSLVINRKSTSDKVMRAVADAIGRDHRAVFPDYYLGPAKRKTSKVHNFH